MRNATGLTVLCLMVAAAAEPQADRLKDVERRFGPPALWVPRPGEPPAIDGKCDEVAWRKALPVTLRPLNGQWETPTQATEARVLSDEKALYFAVTCREAQPQRMISAGAERDGPLWNGDTVEVFLDPGHKQTRRRYVQIIVNPAGLVYDSRNGEASWNANLSVKTGRLEGGWTVELAVPMADLGLAAGIPKVWGLNINRQRPELGEVAPVQGIRGHHEKLKDPAAYREGEDTAWSPTCCRSSHIVQRFGHAVLEAGTVDVGPPERLLDVLFRADFDDGAVRGFENAEIADDNFSGPGKCLAPKGGAGTVNLRCPLKDLDDVTLIYALKMPRDGRLYYYGRAPDDEQCEADRHEVFMTPAAAKARLFPAMDDYDTHGSMMAWKSHGRRCSFPGPWAMMTGHFSEPSIGSVMQPGTDWVIVRTRLGQFRRQTSQGMVPLEQGYPNGLVFHGGRDRFLLDEVVIFRGMDTEGPARVTGVRARTDGKRTVLTWQRSADNTLTAWYRVRAGERVIAEGRDLSATLDAAQVAGGPLTVTAMDLYGNESSPSEAIGAAAPAETSSSRRSGNAEAAQPAAPTHPK